MLILLGSFLGLMILGLPVAFAMAVASLVYMLATGVAPDVVLAQRMIAGTASSGKLSTPAIMRWASTTSGATPVASM